MISPMPSCAHQGLARYPLAFAQKILSPWQATAKDVRAVQALRSDMKFGGYPFHRIQLNQIGDGLITAAAGALLIATAGISPIVAGLFTWGIRVSELVVAVVWNQKMATDRREARIAASQSAEMQGAVSPGQTKAKACLEILSSRKYDFLGASAAIAAGAVLLTGGPIPVVVVLGAVIALSQTMSKFKEMAWSNLRYVVNPSSELRARQVDLQEPMSAYEMSVTVGILTATYVVGFASFALLFAFAAPVTLPVVIATSALGGGLMVAAKQGFKKELAQGMQEHDDFMKHQHLGLGYPGRPKAQP